MNELLDIFIGETREHLEILSGSLLQLEKDMFNLEIINEIFRVTHTIKGSSAMMGLHKMENLSHGLEDVLHDIRDGKIGVDGKLVELCFVCHDFLANCLESVVQTGTEGDFQLDNIMQKLHEIVENRVAVKVEPEVSSNVCVWPDWTLDSTEMAALEDATAGGLKPYKITFSFIEDSQFKAVYTIMIFRLLRQLGTLLKAVPDDNTLKNDSCEPRDVLAILITESEPEQIENEIRNQADMDLTTLDIESYQAILKPSSAVNPVHLGTATENVRTAGTKKSAVAKIVADIIDGSSELVIDVNQAFFSDFITQTIYHIEQIESDLLELESRKDDPGVVFRLYRNFHTIRGMAGFVDFEVVKQVAGETETLLSAIRLGNMQVSRITVDLILESAGFIRKLVADHTLQNNKAFITQLKMHLAKLTQKESEDQGQQIMKQLAQMAENPDEPKIGEILVGQAKLTKPELDQLLLKQQHQKYKGLKLGQVAIKEKKVEPHDVIQSIRIQEEIKETAQNATLVTDFLRIPTIKVDNLVDLVGELLTLHSQIEQDALQRLNSNDTLVNHISRMERIIKDLHQQSMSLRMVSLKSTFQKINRIARDTINELNKNVKFELVGEETEIDRGVADKIQDPLLHMVKNAISHGIESEAERVAGGKSAQGNVRISAYSKKGNVFIAVADDGAGLSTTRILQKAQEKGLVDPGRNYSEDEIVDFIFKPGFSTVETVNHISGRGVGLDVVKTEMNKVGGKIEINTRSGQGSTFTLKIPINFAAMNGMILDILGNRCIIPTSHIKEIVQPAEEQWVYVKGKPTLYRLRDEVISLIPIAEIFGLPKMDDPQDTRLLIVLENEKMRRMLPVRDILGRREIVVKPLMEEFKHLRFASGVSILGDGKASLILDVQNLFAAEIETKQIV